ncbi:MAG: Rha family transcriptional regulator [Magnetococcales bacterium]|nr:Rha family transcriptional regulator [Magnetococcales bacterium]
MNIMSPMAQPRLLVRDQKIFANSLDVAKAFGKQHLHVLEKIRTLDVPEDFNQSNFRSVEYRDAKGEMRPSIDMTRDGFTILTMGFTGKRAMEFKLAYIAEFNRMEKKLRKSGEWQQARAEGKRTRLEETDTIKSFVEYARSQGSKHADKYYMNLTRMENKALFVLEKGLPKPNNIREILDMFQLQSLAVADRLVTKAIEEGMNDGLHYKEIFHRAKEKVIALSLVIGQTPLDRLPLNQGAIQ